MHEASLAGGILLLVERTAERERFSRVSQLRLAAGLLAGVEVSALRFALQAIAPGTLLEGARIDIDEPPGEARCMDCGFIVRIAQRGDACTHCGGYRLQLTGGTELKVIDMLVED